MQAEDDDDAVRIAVEDLLRAQAYSLLSRLLSAPPSTALLQAIGGLTGDSTELGRALRVLSQAANRVTLLTVEQEFTRLFGDEHEAEVHPVVGAYVQGDPTLALQLLAGDLTRLGVDPEEDGLEPADHIASLCEVMAGLITGAYGRPADLFTQQRFFRCHLGCWAPRFFADLEAAPSAAFFMPVGTLGRRFFQVEAAGFSLAA